MKVLDDILQKTEPLIQAIVKSFWSRYDSDPALSYDDLLQEARMAIVQGFKRFKIDPAYGKSSASPSSWVFICVTNHLRGLNGYRPNIEIDEEDICSEAEYNDDLLQEAMTVDNSSGKRCSLEQRHNAAIRIQLTSQRVMQLRKQIVNSWNHELQDILFNEKKEVK
jgi:hypothetical protein